MEAYLTYAVVIATNVGFFLLLALALNLQWGMTGMVNFGVAGFYAIGAYASGLLSQKAGWPLALSMPAAVLCGFVAAAIVALLSIRLKEDFLAIVTLGFGELIRLITLNEDELTEGPRGLKIDARPFAELSEDRVLYAQVYLLFVFAAVVIAFYILERIRRAPLGRTLRAIREDDVVADTMGKNVLAHRIIVFAIGGAIMGAAGALYAHYTQSISPEHFLPFVAILVWMSVITGGPGNNWGLIVGATVVMIIYEGSRFLSDIEAIDAVIPADKLAAIRIIAIGVMLILILRLSPRGLVPETRFRYRSRNGAAKSPSSADRGETT